MGGHVRVYEYDETILEWTQLGQDIDGKAEYDESGWSVSLSSDGKTVAIGAPYNDDNGFVSGHVRVYEYDETILEWTQLGQDIDGEAEVDRSGRSVSLSSDGKTVAIGAPYNDGNGHESGHVRIFTYEERSTSPTSAPSSSAPSSSPPSSSPPSTSAGKTMILSLGAFVFGLIMM